MNDDYGRAKGAGLTGIDRWGLGVPHHPMSRRLMGFLKEHAQAMTLPCGKHSTLGPRPPLSVQ